jgi:imidazole glycerol phosphate synthase glutamine amidotransferase subunit
MSSIVGVVKYGVAGNIHSIVNAIKAAGGTVKVIEKPSDISGVGRLVLPGVGSFHDGIEELGRSNLIEAIRLCNKPVLGICLGMQIFAKIGFEYGRTNGLGIINAEVKAIECDGPVPHVGFNSIKTTNKDPLFTGIENDDFYFMHSFEVVNYTDILALTEYAGHEFVSAVRKGNFYGVQFHPEKSREAGITLFKNFINI